MKESEKEKRWYIGLCGGLFFMNGKENISDVWDLWRWLERGYVVCGMLRFISLCLCGLLSLSKFGLYLTPLDIFR